jgi:hypothetical protein
MTSHGIISISDIKKINQLVKKLKWEHTQAMYFSHECTVLPEGRKVS